MMYPGNRNSGPSQALNGDQWQQQLPIQRPRFEQPRPPSVRLLPPQLRSSEDHSHSRQPLLQQTSQQRAPPPQPPHMNNPWPMHSVGSQRHPTQQIDLHQPQGKQPRPDLHGQQPGIFTRGPPPPQPQQHQQPYSRQQRPQVQQPVQVRGGIPLPSQPRVPRLPQQPAGPQQRPQLRPRPLQQQPPRHRLPGPQPGLQYRGPGPGPQRHTQLQGPPPRQPRQPVPLQQQPSYSLRGQQPETSHRGPPPRPPPPPPPPPPQPLLKSQQPPPRLTKEQLPPIQQQPNVPFSPPQDVSQSHQPSSLHPPFLHQQPTHPHDTMSVGNKPVEQHGFAFNAQDQQVSYTSNGGGCDCGDPRCNSTGYQSQEQNLDFANSYGDSNSDYNNDISYQGGEGCGDPNCSGCSESFGSFNTESYDTQDDGYWVDNNSNNYNNSDNYNHNNNDYDNNDNNNYSNNYNSNSNNNNNKSNNDDGNKNWKNRSGRTNQRFNNDRPVSKNPDKALKNSECNKNEQNSGGHHCEPCKQNFPSKHALTQHQSNHRTCEEDGCNFRASAKTLMLHFIQNHQEGPFRIILDTPEDIAKWRAERKRNWPSPANIEAKERKLAQDKEDGILVKTNQFVYRERFSDRDHRGRGRGRGRGVGRGVLRKNDYRKESRTNSFNCDRQLKHGTRNYEDKRGDDGNSNKQNEQEDAVLAGVTQTKSQQLPSESDKGNGMQDKKVSDDGLESQLESSKDGELKSDVKHNEPNECQRKEKEDLEAEPNPLQNSKESVTEDEAKTTQEEEEMDTSSSPCQVVDRNHEQMGSEGHENLQSIALKDVVSNAPNIHSEREEGELESEEDDENEMDEGSENKENGTQFTNGDNVNQSTASIEEKDRSKTHEGVGETNPLCKKCGDFCTCGVNDESDKKCRTRRGGRGRKRVTYKGTVTQRPRRRVSLLEMLLANEIRHERNVILQCIRYIVKNDYLQA